jgi:hypothetical protein
LSWCNPDGPHTYPPRKDSRRRAEETGLSAKKLADVIEVSRSISACPLRADFWMNLQSAYELDLARKESGEEIHYVLLGDNTRYFDVLVGYFFVSGFHQLYPALEKTEKVRVLVGLKADRATVDLLAQAKEQQGELDFHSQAEAKETVQQEIAQELQESQDTAAIEAGIRKFIEWARSGKLEIRAYPSQKLHAKLYIMTFHDKDRDKGIASAGERAPLPLLRVLHRPYPPQHARRFMRGRWRLRKPSAGRLSID